MYFSVLNKGGSLDRLPFIQHTSLSASLASLYRGKGEHGIFLVFTELPGRGRHVSRMGRMPLWCSIQGGLLPLLGESLPYSQQGGPKDRVDNAEREKRILDFKYQNRLLKTESAACRNLSLWVPETIHDNMTAVHGPSRKQPDWGRTRGDRPQEERVERQGAPRSELQTEVSVKTDSATSRTESPLSVSFER